MTVTELDRQTEPEIEFQGIKPTPVVKAAVGRHVAQLEELWGR